VHLTLRGAGADGAPGDQVGNILRRNHVEVLGCRRHAHFVEIAQQLASGPQALVDVEALVEIRIVDEPLPAHRGPRLFEVHPHDDDQVTDQTLLDFEQALAIFDGRPGIVDGAGSDDDQQAVVLTPQDRLDLTPRLEHRLRGCRGDRKLLMGLVGGDDFLNFGNPEVVGIVGIMRDRNGVLGQIHDVYSDGGHSGPGKNS